MSYIKNDKGFTLLEILVVIAIIGILSVVAITNVYKSINKAKAKKLVVEMNTIYDGIIAYCLDNGSWDLNIMDNSSNGVISNHMYLKEYEELQTYFDPKISTTPFGGWYYIQEDGNKIYVTITADPPKGSYNGIKEYREKYNEALQGISIINNMKDQIEMDSNNNIKVEDGVSMTIDKK